MTIKETSRKAAARHAKLPVGFLTQDVNGAGFARMREALVAAEIYAGRIIATLYEAVTLMRTGESAEAREELSGAVRGIHCLAELLAAAAQATGLDMPAVADQELGRLAMSLHELDVARARTRGSVEETVTVIEGRLVPALSRLVPSFTHLESCIASLGREMAP